MAVTWRGEQFDQRSVDMLVEVERLTGYTLNVMQGSYSGGVSASAGTHNGCGAVDLSIWGLNPDTLVHEMRRVGWAAWERTTAQGFDPHVHGIAVQPGGKGDRGCLHASAHDQVVDYFENRNGLASGARDDATREFVGVTWESYSLGQGEPEPGVEWLIEGVLTMASVPVVFFLYDGGIYEADILAGTYRRINSDATLNDRMSMLDTLDIPRMDWTPGVPVGNPDAFGVLID